MLIKVKEYLKNHGDTSLSELRQQFDIEPDALRDMLDKLIEKGLVRKKHESLKQCNKCTQCPKLSNNEIYEWVGK